jgi:AcrR family transcriptional regulator
VPPSNDTRSAETRAKLLTAAAATLRDAGIAGLSARTIATAASVNQALIFYHFGSVSALVQAAAMQAADDRVEYYRDQFAVVESLPELLRLGRALHERERELGNVAMMAQLMAGAQQDENLAAAARYGMQVWSNEIESVVRRVLADSPLAVIADPAGLARAVSASFIGLQLYDGVDPDSARAALDSLEHLGALVEVMDDLGPVARRALQSKVRKARGVARPPRKSDTSV